MGYTVQVRKILQSYLITKHGYTYEQAKNSPYSNTISITHGDLFSFDYDLFDSSYKSVLETKILKHYYMREVGLETVEQFKLFLDMKLNEILPYYNQLYKSELLKINPLLTHEYNESSTKQLEQSSQANSDTTNNSNSLSKANSQLDASNTNKEYDQPQTGSAVTLGYITKQLNDEGINTTTESGEMTNTGLTNTKGTASNDSLEKYIHSITGFTNVSQSKLLIEFRETFLNIDKMVIDDLNDLFFMLLS